ncbi:hypothetical protein HBI73_209830 [Parastagonospora nodorum]|nr:hypothetical protein HBI73_209830 [Parastagonospora nodorum]
MLWRVSSEYGEFFSVSLTWTLTVHAVLGAVSFQRRLRTNPFWRFVTMISCRN